MKFSLKWLGDFIPLKNFMEEPEKIGGAPHSGRFGGGGA